MKTKHKSKQPKFKQDAAYEWFESVMDNGGAFFIVLALFGAIPFGIFWLGCQVDSCANTNNTPMLVGYFLSFFIILELLYIWLCKNEKYLDEDYVIPFKLMALVMTCIIMNIIVPSLYGIYYLLKDYLIDVLSIIGGLILTVLGLYIFFKLNELILLYIKDSRKSK